MFRCHGSWSDRTRTSLSDLHALVIKQIFKTCPELVPDIHVAGFLQSQPHCTMNWASKGKAQHLQENWACEPRPIMAVLGGLGESCLAISCCTCLHGDISEGNKLPFQLCPVTSSQLFSLSQTVNLKIHKDIWYLDAQGSVPYEGIKLESQQNMNLM